MALNYKTNGGGSYKTVPAGSHAAVCDIVADVGLQPGFGAYPEPKHQVYIRFEIPAERISWEDKSGQRREGPAVMGTFYTASMHEKANLRKALEGWRGKSFTDEEAEHFDIESILGKSCMLSIVEKPKGDGVKAVIAGISSLPKGVKAVKAELPLLLFNPEADNSCGTADLPEWLAKKIEGQLESQPEPPSRNGNGVSFDDGTYITDDDIPF